MSILFFIACVLVLVNSVFISRIENEEKRVGFTALASILILATSSLSGMLFMNRQLEKHAARIGVGRYEADPITGDTEFKWNKEK